MAPRKKNLTQKEIEKLMAESDDENYADSDSECDELIDIYADDDACVEVDEEPADFNDEIQDTEEEEKIQWKTAEENKNFKLKILKFEGPTPGPIANIKDFTELDLFHQIFDDNIMKTLVVERNRYAEETINNRKSATPTTKNWKPVDEKELLQFLGLVLLMGHIEKDEISDYWSTDELTETPIFSKTMPRDRFLLILRYLHFSDNSKKLKNDDPQFDRLWKTREVFEMLNSNFKKL
ncbi:hypothetical protein JTE90_006625 [Oedothorax gibbosus]|uniref:PiggyBac transposable element-derived protein domain-containing protein n=1 Tax=Oedothorax gibbosus TaxID=931172 RepID=A0AAV6U7X7_9ARAC|nr:hypothetical protein JTE90_006625 [Oedothorax gibbosus]